MTSASPRENAGSPKLPKVEECAPDIIKITGMANTGVIITEDGVVVVDTPATGSSMVVEAIRARTQVPIHTIIQTHGHGDHAWSIGAFLKDAGEKGYPKPRIIAQELLLKRFQRYRELARHNQYINNIQFGRSIFTTGDQREERAPAPPEAANPNITYSEEMQFRLGGLTFELYHYLGETDDGTWVYIPERKTAIAGDLVIQSSPNIGNPFKIQRFEVEWADALEKIARKNPDVLIPGHGRLLRGQAIQEVCLDTAKYLRHIHDEVVKLLNEGCWIEEILERVKVPEDLAGKPWLNQSYGCLNYIIHGIQRRYAGWYNGNPSELFPARSSAIAAEVVSLAGEDKLIERARKLQQEGDIQLALHQLDFVIRGTQDTSRRKEALLLKAELLSARAEAENNFIAKNIFLSGVKTAGQEAESL